MKLQRVELAFGVFDRGEGGIFGMRDGAEAFGERGQLVAVAVPDVDLLAEPVEERGALVDVQKSGAVFAAGAELDLAAEMPRHQLHPVADAENGHA